MKIYIATPVNGRKEGTLEEKREAAWKRVNYLRKIFKETNPKAKCHSSFDDDIAPLSKPIELLPESVVMGKCVTRVMECDAILMDYGCNNSKGSMVELFTAQQYGKKILFAVDLNIKPEMVANPKADEREKITNCLCCKHCLPPAKRDRGMCMLDGCHFEEA